LQTVVSKHRVCFQPNNFVVRSLQTVTLHKARKITELNNVLLFAGNMHKRDAKHQQKDMQTFGLLWPCQYDGGSSCVVI
jgi:hypothetical protein